MPMPMVTLMNQNWLITIIKVKDMNIMWNLPNILTIIIITAELRNKHERTALKVLD